MTLIEHLALFDRDHELALLVSDLDVADFDSPEAHAKAVALFPRVPQPCVLHRKRSLVWDVGPRSVVYTYTDR